MTHSAMWVAFLACGRAFEPLSPDSTAVVARAIGRTRFESSQERDAVWEAFTSSERVELKNWAARRGRMSDEAKAVESLQ